MNKNNESYIKLLRKITDWEWFTNSKMVHLWIYFLLKAEFEEKIHKGIKIERGQFIIDKKKTMSDIHISAQALKTYTNRLITSQQVTIKSTNKYTIVTICKYDEYQFNGKASNQQKEYKLTDKQPTSSNQLVVNEVYIKLRRKIIDWEWFSDSQMVHLWIYFLLKVNYTEKTWKGIKLNKGQLVIGRKSTSRNTSISEQSIKTCLKRLITNQQVTIKPTNKYTLVTIVKYDDYNNSGLVTNQQKDAKETNKQLSTNQQLTTAKEYINNTNKELNLFKEKEDEIFSANFFYLKLKRWDYAVSEYIKNNLAESTNTWKMQNKEIVSKIPCEEIFKKMDAESVGKVFQDDNHINNAFRKLYRDSVAELMKNNLQNNYKSVKKVNEKPSTTEIGDSVLNLMLRKLN